MADAVQDKANTPDEIVDTVNERDEVIGQSTKRVVNSDPKLIHREIGILIYDEKNRLLTQQRSKHKKVDPLIWIISVAGHVPSGKLPEEAAYMEMKEELGISVPLTFIEKDLLHYENETHFAYFYIGKVRSTAKIVLDKNEAEEFRFVNQTDIKSMQVAGSVFEQYSLEAFNRFWRGEYKKLL